MIAAVDLADMTFDELTAYVKKQAARAVTECPEKAAELAMMAQVMEEKGPGDGNQTRQYIADTLNACPKLVSSGRRFFLWAGIGLVAWFFLKG